MSKRAAKGAPAKLSEEQKQEIREAFDLFDTDGSGAHPPTHTPTCHALGPWRAPRGIWARADRLARAQARSMRRS